MSKLLSKNGKNRPSSEPGSALNTSRKTMGSPSGPAGQGRKRGGAAANAEASAPTLKEMNMLVKQLKEELSAEKEQRNYYQLEKDKILQFWEITKQDLENLKSELRNKDREMEEMEERHQVEIKVHKQKVKHLHYEHQNNITQLKTDEESSLKTQNDEHRQKEHLMKKTNKKIKSEMKELEMSHEDVIKNLKQENEKTITKLRHEFERNTRELHLKYERKMKQLRQEMELKRKNEIHEIEERKNAHIGELIKKHDLAFAEIKSYYNDITANNLELIKSLKEQLEDMKKKEASDQKLMLEVTMENKRLSEPLQKANKEVESLRTQLANYTKDKESLQTAKARAKVLESELRTLRWEHEVLEQRFVKVQKERDDLYTKFVSSIHEVQQKSGLRNLLLEKKLETMTEELETREVQLKQVVASANLDTSQVKGVTQQVEHVLEEKNKSIKELQYELARTKKAKNDLIRVYESKLKEFGVPLDELGFRVQLSEESVTSTPANLVTA